MTTLRLRALILLFGTAVLGAYAQLITFVPDAITFGILDSARNVAEGRGLVTGATTPAFLPYYEDVTPPFPYLWYPLLPFVTSWFFRLFGPEPWLVRILPMAAYFASGLLLFELGRRLFSPVTGFLAAIFLLLQPFMIETAVRENFTDTVLVALLVASVLAVFVASEAKIQRPAAWLAFAGLLLGLSQYARSAATMLYLPMIVLVATAFDRRRASRLAVFLGACLITQLPLFIWNVIHIGSLTFTPTYVLLCLTPSFPGLSAFARVMPTDLREVLRLYGSDILQKWLSQVWVHFKYFFAFTSPLVLGGAVLSVFSTLTRPQQVLRNFTAVLYITLVLLNSLFIWDNRYLLPAIPFVALVGVKVLRGVVSAAPLSRYARQLAVAAIALLAAVEGIDFFYQTWKSRPQYPSILRDAVERSAFMKTHLRPDDVVMAVDAPLIAWETRNTAVGLPIDPETAATIRDRFVKFNTLVLETRRPRSDLFGYSADWYRIATGEQAFFAFQREASATLSTGQTLILLRGRGTR